MKIALKVELNDGTIEDIDAVFADFVGFERTWQRSVAKFENELRLTDLGWLAWSALTRAKKTTLKFDPEWIATVVTVMPREEGEIPLVTASDQPTG
jgi:hypothetical protein